MLSRVLAVVDKQIEKKKEHISNTQLKIPKFYVENSNRKNHGAARKSAVLSEIL